MTILGDTIEQTGIPKFIGWHQNEQNEDSIVRKATAAALYPFQLATSPIAIKTYLTTILFLFTSFVLLSISTTAYGFFYYNYIPQTDLEAPIYLQYDTEHYPTAEIPLDASALISQQPYDVSITLHMPYGPINKASGNFMLDLSLHGSKDTLQSTILESVNLEQVIPSTALHRSRRPALMPYSSTPIRLIHKLARIPLHLLTSSQSHDPDSATLTVPMFEKVEFARGKDNIPTRAKLVIQTQRPSGTIFATHGTMTLPIPHIEIYSAKLTFQVRFHGLRYLIYNHRILSFIVFSTLFYGVSISTVAIVWAALAVVLRTASSSPSDRSLVKSEKSPTIKQEHDTSDPLRTESDYTVKTAKRLSDESEDNAAAPGQKQEPGTIGYTSGTSEEASLASLQVQAAVADISEEQADDEEEESEDEWQQLQRLRRKMEKDARERERERQMMAERDSGLGTSLESDNRQAGGAGGVGLVRRRSNKRSEGEKE